MAVISVIINESSNQIIAGIPKTIAISTNIASTIFYTLDGTTPTIYSTIYTGPIYMPTNLLSVELKVFASNGSDTSPVITEIYQTNILQNAKLSHSTTTAPEGTNYPNLYPFGTNASAPNANYLNPGNAGVNVNDPALPTISAGFDGEGNPTSQTNLPYNSQNYNIVYSKTNAIGEVTVGVGDLPAKVTVKPEASIPESSNSYDKLFDPRALVIFQDISKEDPSLPPNINKMSFSLEDSDRARYGNNYFTAGLDSQQNTGTFLRSHYNPRDNSITYYYLGTISNKWIISKTPYQPKTTAPNLAGMVLSKSRSAGMVFQWYPFNRRHLT